MTRSPMRLACVLVALALLGGGLAPRSARGEEGDEAFPALARRSGVLKRMYQAYVDQRDTTAKGLAFVLATPDVENDVLASEDVAAAAKAPIDDVVDVLEEKLLDLQNVVTLQQAGDRKALLEAFKAWSKTEIADVQAARELAGEMAATRALLALELQDWELYWVVLKGKLIDLKKLATALGKAYRRVDEILVMGADAEVLKRERLIFQPMTWAARSLEDILAAHAKAIEAEVKKAYPAERHAAAFATIDRLLTGKQFVRPGWIKALADAKPYLDKALQRAVDEHQKVLDVAAPLFDETLLLEVGAPFDDVKFDGIKDAYYALYGRLLGASGG